MKLVIDTNIIISGLLKQSITRKILLSEFFEFYLPEIVMKEVKKYSPYIMEKSDLSQDQLKNLLSIFLENITLVPMNKYKDKMNEAMEIMAKIDEKDSQFIALALAIKNDGIWSNDRHFEKQDKIQVFNTSDIINFFKKKSKK
jgi:putative PIN family toxin of toxin-antitoxin system